MVRLFVGLRLRSAANRLQKGSRSDRLLMAWGVVVLVGAGLAGFVLLATARAGSDGGGSTAIFVVFLSAFGMWLLPALTLATPANDLSVDRFAMLPLTVGQKVRGLLGARLISLAGLAGGLVALGAVVGYAPGGWGSVLVVALAVAELAVCLIVSRVVAGVLEIVLDTRRARDLAVVVVVALMAGYYTLSRRFLDVSSGSELPVAGIWAQVVPPGALAHGVLEARAGGVVVPLVALAYSLAVCGLALLIWAVVLARQPTFRPSHARVRRVEGGLGLYPPVLRFLPRNRFGATTAAELRYFLFRNPRQGFPYLWGVIYSLLFGGAALLGAPETAPLFMVYLVVFTGIMGGPGLFQSDGPALWMPAVATGRFRETVYGKLLARALLVGTVVAVAVVLDCAYTASLVPALAGIPLAVGAYGIVGGCGAQIAVRNPGAGGRQQGCAPVTLLLLVVELALFLPGVLLVAASTLVTGTLVWGAWLAGIYGAVAGAAIARHAAIHAETHLPELIAAGIDAS